MHIPARMHKTARKFKPVLGVSRKNDEREKNSTNGTSRTPCGLPRALSAQKFLVLSFLYAC